MYYIDESFTAKQINKALKENREIIFKAGTYNLGDCLILYSNTRVTCENNTKFRRCHRGRMLQLDVSPETTGYTGTHDVQWQGGTFIADTHSENANVISLFHGKNITLRGLVITGCRGYHSIEVNACMHVVIDKCNISDQLPKEGETFREAIQIDFANKDGLATKNAKGTSPCYDGTHCVDIVVKNTKITNCPNGFGTHTVSVEERYHRNIELTNVTFERMHIFDLQLFGVNGFIYSGSPVVAHIGIKKQAHKNSGGKVKLDTERRNKHIVINGILFD